MACFYMGSLQGGISTTHFHFSTIRPMNLAFHSDVMQLDKRILSGIVVLVNWRPV
jgi:hypothetical protein